MIVIAAIFVYIGTWLMIFQAFIKRTKPSPIFKYTVPLAIALHAWAASDLVMTSEGVRLGFFQMASVFFVAMNIIVLLSAIKKPISNLFLMLLPLCVLTLACSAAIHTREPVSALSYGLVGHIVLSVIAYSLLTLATLQAILLNYQNSRLRNHHVKSVLGIFPPLQTMESLLFDLVWGGFLLLSLSIATGFLFIEDMFAQRLSHKTIFSVFSWLIYATLLGGRHILGWRGRVATRWVITGFAMLMLAYFGSKFVIEFILR